MRPVLVIAEAGVNHDGLLTRALELVDAAADAGADYVKFQTFTAASIVMPSAPKARYQQRTTPADETQFDMLRRLELSHPDHRELARHARERGIGFLSTPFDRSSLAFLVDDMKLDLVKLPSSDLTNLPLLLDASRSRAALIISTGMATMGEVERALAVLAFGATRPGPPPRDPDWDEAFMNPESQRVLRNQNSGAPGSNKPTVVYYVDYFANHHDPELGEAFVRVLEHNGYRVFIPQSQTVCGMAMFSNGDLTGARTLAEQNIRALIEPAREGYSIVCTEPTAALCLTQEYPMLVQNDDAGIVAQQTTDAGSFLADLHRRGLLKRDFSPLPMRIAWHTPCHVKALQKGTPMLELLALIPELTVLMIEKGCSGMAGTFGIAAANFSKSVEIGAGLINEMQTIDAVAGVTDCSSCRMQMEQAATIPTIHPIKLLALSYGLMPRLSERLKSRPSGLVMS